MFQFNDDNDDNDDNILNLLNPPQHSIKTGGKIVSFSADVAAEQHRQPLNGGRNDRASSSLPKSLSLSTSLIVGGGTDEVKQGIVSDKDVTAGQIGRGISSSPRNTTNANENRHQQQHQIPYANKKTVVAGPSSFSRTKGVKPNTLLDIDDLLRMDDDDVGI